MYIVFIGFEFFFCSFYDVLSIEYCFGYLYIIFMGKNMVKYNFCVKICMFVDLFENLILIYRMILVIFDFIFFRRVKYNNEYFIY